LHRIEGQVRGVERMVDEDRYCIDILTQVGAVKTALESLGFEILEDHVTHCVRDALASGDAKTVSRKSEELLAAVERFTKTGEAGAHMSTTAAPSPQCCTSATSTTPPRRPWLSGCWLIVRASHAWRPTPSRKRPRSSTTRPQPRSRRSSAGSRSAVTTARDARSGAPLATPPQGKGGRGG